MKSKEVENKNSIFAKIPYVMLIGFTGIISLVMAVLAIKLTVYFDVKINFASESCVFRSESVLLNVFLVFATFLIFYILYKIADKINKKIIFVLMLVVTTALGFFWIYTIQFKPVADQLMVKECATAILDNKLEDILAPRRILK